MAEIDKQTDLEVLQQADPAAYELMTAFYEGDVDSFELVDRMLDLLAERMDQSEAELAAESGADLPAFTHREILHAAMVDRSVLAAYHYGVTTGGKQYEPAGFIRADGRFGRSAVTKALEIISTRILERFGQGYLNLGLAHTINSMDATSVMLNAYSDRMELAGLSAEEIDLIHLERLSGTALCMMRGWPQSRILNLHNAVPAVADGSRDTFWLGRLRDIKLKAGIARKIFDRANMYSSEIWGEAAPRKMILLRSILHVRRSSSDYHGASYYATFTDVCRNIHDGNLDDAEQQIVDLMIARPGLFSGWAKKNLAEAVELRKIAIESERAESASAMVVTRAVAAVRNGENRRAKMELERRQTDLQDLVMINSFVGATFRFGGYGYKKPIYELARASQVVIADDDAIIGRVMGVVLKSWRKPDGGVEERQRPFAQIACFKRESGTGALIPLGEIKLIARLFLSRAKVGDYSEVAHEINLG